MRQESCGPVNGGSGNGLQEFVIIVKKLFCPKNSPWTISSPWPGVGKQKSLMSRHAVNRATPKKNSFSPRNGKNIWLP